MPLLHVAGAGAVNVARLANGQSLAISNTATHFGAVSAQMIRLVGDTAFCWKAATGATAATTDNYQAAGAAEYFVVGLGDRISAITATGGSGVVWMQEVI